MRRLFFIGVLAVVLLSCDDAYKRETPEIKEGKCIAVPEDYRSIIGCDSLQLIFGGRGRYNDKKHDFDVTWDSLYVNFCYPNKWAFEKFKAIERLKSEGIIIGTQKGDLLFDNAVKKVYNK